MSGSRSDKQIAAVLFDLDDTLIDWSQQTEPWDDLASPGIGRIYDFLSGQGCSLPARDQFGRGYRENLMESWRVAKETWAGVSFANVWRNTLEALEVNTLGIDFDEVMRAYGYSPIPGVCPFPDTIPVLETLLQRGYRTGLVTNAMFPLWMIDIALHAYDMLDLLEVRVTSGDIGFMKPHPAIYHAILEMLEAPAERAVFVGDRPANDIAGANDVGLVSVLMSPPHLERDLDGVEPDYTISCLSELLPILDELERA